ncbi:hypothetical protein SADUNF_Sadunf14G0142500 [Salix dunnii]|uniref:Tetratricopeptide repeat-like superfamily protein n=1 Tax=Salix dunnii TaxID=1413687 RepID=A0A835JJU1_9ROSI|nr:hypothetical protein SADUNF_Sadunf14G0142500 [Salix dunnii]
MKEIMAMRGSKKGKGKAGRVKGRIGVMQDAFSLYEQAIAIEKGREHPLVLPALYAQYDFLVSSCLPNHLLSGKEGPFFRVCGAFLLPNGVFLMHISFIRFVFPFVNMVMDSIYWIRYVLCMVMSTYGNMDLANNALARATQVFVRYGVFEACFTALYYLLILVIACHGKLLRQPDINLFAARFNAQAAYRVVHAEIGPGLLEAITKHGSSQDAFSLFEQAIATEKGREHPLVLPALYTHYARFIYLTFLPQPKQIDYLDSVVDNFILTNSYNVNPASASEREELVCIFLKVDIYSLSRKWKELVDKARAKQLQPQEYHTGVGHLKGEAEEVEKYIVVREETYKKAKEFDSKISDFESAIRWPCFHVRPLNVAKLEKWHNYLDMIEREDDFNKRLPGIHLFAARFNARAPYRVVHAEIGLGLLEAVTKHANMENQLPKQIDYLDSLVDSFTSTSSDSVNPASAFERDILHFLGELKTVVEASAASAAAVACTLLEDGGQAEKGEVHPHAAELPSKPVSAGLGEAEEVEKYIVVREEIYKKAKEFDSKIFYFESAIRWPCFHVRPLNVAELETGREHRLVLPALYAHFEWLCITPDMISWSNVFSLLVTIYAKCLMSWASTLDTFILCNEYLLLLFNADIKKLTESQEVAVAVDGGLITLVLQDADKALVNLFWVGFSIDILGVGHLKELKTAVEASVAAAVACTLLEDGGQAEKGEVHPHAAELPSKPVSAGLGEAEEVDKYLLAFRTTSVRQGGSLLWFLWGLSAPQWSISYAYLLHYRRHYILCMVMSTYGNMDLANNALYYLARATRVFVKTTRYSPFVACFNVGGAYRVVHAKIALGLLVAVTEHGASVDWDLGIDLVLRKALIHLETFLPQPKQIDYLDSLVDNFTSTYNSSVNIAVVMAVDGGLITHVLQDADKALVNLFWVGFSIDILGFDHLKGFCCKSNFVRIKDCYGSVCCSFCSMYTFGGWWEVEKGEFHPHAVELPSKPESVGLEEVEEVEKYIVVREEIYKKAKEFDSKISDFENVMRRPCFHMRPLNVVSSCLPNHLLSGKEGPSFRVCGAFLLPNGVFLMHISFMLCVFPLKVNMLMDSIIKSKGVTVTTLLVKATTLAMAKHLGWPSERQKRDVHPHAAELPSKPVSAGLGEAEEEEKRPYFLVRSLNVAELENWHNYWDMIEREDDFNKAVNLYERCIIACATYTEYWIRYVLCMVMSTYGNMDVVNIALNRATQVFVKRQPDIHLFVARFNARAAYRVVHGEIAPALLEAVTKHANMEHRLGNLEDSFSLFEQAIAIEKGREHPLVLPALYDFLTSKNLLKARKVLVEALENARL